MGAIQGGATVLLPDLSSKPIEEIVSGDIVLSHKGNPQKVKFVHNEYLGKPMYRLNLVAYHKSPLFTEDHPVLTIDKSEIVSAKKEAVLAASRNSYDRTHGKTSEFVGQDTWREKVYEPSFKHASEIEIDDLVLVPSKFPLVEGASENSDFYYLVGAFLGDGYIRKDKNGNWEGITFCLGSDEIELCDKIHKLIKKYSKSEPCNVECEDRNGLYVSVYDRKLCEWFADCIGTGSKNKRIKFYPKFKEDAKQILAGYLDTDGCIVDRTNQNVRGNKFGGFQISSANKGLLEDIQQLLISFGNVSRISTQSRYASENSVVNVDTVEHTLSTRSNSSELFKNSIKLANSSFDKAEIKAGKTFVTHVNGVPYMACPVKSVEKVNFQEPVYDLTVEEDESYVADGIAVHNCTVEYSECNICGNKAERTEDYCTHIRNRKGRSFTGSAKDVKTGEIKQFKNEPVFEYNFGIKFIELSAVVDPACPTCHIDGIVPNDNYLKRVANMQNELFMIKSSAIEKKASQEDVDQLNEVLQTLEDISINLIKNRQQVETEFASDLVAILSNLQTFVDELVGGGYGSVPGVGEAPAEGAPQEGGEVPPAEMPEMPAQGAPAQGAPVQGAPAEAPAPAGIGTQMSTGAAPTAPVSPQFPITAPVKPMGSAFNINQIHRISDYAKVANTLRNKIVAFNNVGENDMARRRTVSAKKEQKDKAIEVLSNSWQEKQAFFEYIKQVPLLQDNDNKLSIERQDDTFVIVASSKNDNENGKQVWTYEDLTDEERGLVTQDPHNAALHFLKSYANQLQNNSKKGVEIMTDIREAGATSVNKEPEVVTQAQLEDEKGLYHSRTDEERNEVTQAQLESERKGEKDYITEKQLDDAELKLNPRANEEAEVITQAQLEDDSSGVSPRKYDEWNEITQSQLDSHGNRTGNEPEVITEKQLDTVAAPWERAASRDASMFKSAGEHMQATVNVMADSAIATGATPAEIVAASRKLVASTQDRYNLLEKLVDPKAVKKESISFANRLAYWSDKHIKLASVTSDEIKDLLASGLQAVAHDETINPETIVDAVDVVAEIAESQKSISDAIDIKLEASKTENEKQASVKDELRQALLGEDQKKEARSEERKEILASLDKSEKGGVWKETVASAQKGGADTVIEGNFSELGCRYAKGENDKEFRQAVKKFASDALSTENMKLASIINVTIKDETVQIAVKTDERDESVEIPIGGGATQPAAEEMVPEGNIGGGGLENTLPAPEATPAQEMGMMSGAFAKSSEKMTKEAQFGGGTGGGVPNTPGEVAAPGAPEDVPGNDPAGDAVQNLTQEDADMDEIPTAGEKQLPWCICPECGSSDVDIEDTGDETNCTCKAPDCGCQFVPRVKKTIDFLIKNPGEGNAGEDAIEPEVPEIPQVPVAAETRLDKAGFLRMASNYKKRGHVCPSCGMNHCKASKDEEGHSEFTCPACSTNVTKDVLVNSENIEESVMRVAWYVYPTEKCEDCEEKAVVFASRLKIEGMIREAQNNEDSPFPMANCLERIARKLVETLLLLMVLVKVSLWQSVYAVSYLNWH